MCLITPSSKLRFWKLCHWWCLFCSSSCHCGAGTHPKVDHSAQLTGHGSPQRWQCCDRSSPCTVAQWQAFWYFFKAFFRAFFIIIKKPIFFKGCQEGFLCTWCKKKHWGFGCKHNVPRMMKQTSMIEDSLAGNVGRQFFCINSFWLPKKGNLELERKLRTAFLQKKSLKFHKVLVIVTVIVLRNSHWKKFLRPSKNKFVNFGLFVQAKALQRHNYRNVWTTVWKGQLSSPVYVWASQWAEVGGGDSLTKSGFSQKKKKVFHFYIRARALTACPLPPS